MSYINQAIRRMFRRLGYHIERRQFGQDLFSDIAEFGPVNTVFDVGANVGDTAKQFASAFPSATVYAFEPDRRVFPILKSRVSERIHALNVAVGAEPGRAVLNLSERSEGNSLLPFTSDAPVQGAWATTIGQCEIPVTTIDRFCLEENIDSIDVLKLDIQGYELEALKGASRMLDSTRIVFTEVEFQSIYKDQPCFEEIYSFLIDRDFQLAAIYNKNRNSNGGLLWCDALFIKDSQAQRPH